ncbi:MAG: hypothetical protein EXR65_04985 [Dehalococcoidia bacterium]|nr:hypothetical protein [Dehalococcoidia bacterium]
MNPQTPRRVARVAVVLAAAVLTACGGSAGPARWDARGVAESISDAPFTPVNVNSNLGVGRTRLAFALFKPDQTLVIEAQVTARLYRLAGDPEQQPTAATAAGTFTLNARTIDVADHQGARWPGDRPRGAPGAPAMHDVALAAPRHDAPPAPAHDGALSTVFTAMVEFTEAGLWGIELDVKAEGKTHRGLRLTLRVLPHTSEPAVGDAAPGSKQAILKDVANIADIDSARPPHLVLHDITLADAIGSGRPVVAAFVTPAFCQTRFCGPVLDTVVLPAWKAYGDRVQFVHIEPFDIPAARKGSFNPVPAAKEWRLLSEPFIAVIDRQGKVAAKLEGIVALEELTQALDAVLAAP